MKRLSWKYLAGLIDGEGCLDVAFSNISGVTYIRPRLRIAMTTPAKEVLECCQANHGGHIYKRTPKNTNWCESTSWELVGYKDVCMFLRNVTNHLYIKQEQARFLLWMETHLKGKAVPQEVRTAVRDELKLMKRDPHRLSEEAAALINELLKR